MKRIVAFAAFTLLACGPSGTGTLRVELTDAPNPNVQSIFVTISKVTVVGDQGPETAVSSTPYTVDLLTLKDHTTPLGQVTLPAGNVGQIRLELDPNGPQYVVLTDGTQQPLKVPSGTQTGIKLVGQFPVNPCATHTVVLDFDGENSIETHPTGSGSEWILRPVVRVKTESDTPNTCNADGGTPTDPDGGSALH
jgi:hypothetical protein